MKKAFLFSVSLLLVLAILAAAIPVPTMAAGTTCEKTYTIKNGDTKQSVAAATGMTWAEIVALNNLSPTYKVIPGNKLCYGTTKTTTAATTTTTTAPATTTTITTPGAITAVVTGDRVRVSAKNAANDRLYLVRARDAKKTTGGWFNIGKFRTIKGKNSSTSFQVPKDLKGILPLTVCFKEGQSQKLTCVKVTK